MPIDDPLDPSADEKRRIKMPSLGVVLKQMEDQKKARVRTAAIELSKGQFPTPFFVRDVIGELVGDEKEELLSKHAFYQELCMREGFTALFATAHSAFVEICRHEAAISRIAETSERTLSTHLALAVEEPIQKDVMAYTAAAKGIIDVIRRLRKRRNDIEGAVAALVAEHFMDGATAFVKDLRNNLAHGSVVLPGWNITTTPEGTLGAMRFVRNDLLRRGKWSPLARDFMDAEENIDVGKTIGTHFEKLKRFNGAVIDFLARNVREDERDYYDIVDTQNRWAAQQWFKILVRQVGNNKNPYDFLHRFFSPKEVRLILRLPNHSKEQAELVISLKGSESACDDDLRQAVYDIFKVPPSTV